MKKIYKAIGISTGLLLIALFFCKITGVFTWYKNSTPSNEPTLKTGDIFFSTNLNNPHRGNFVIYYEPYIDSIMQSSEYAAKNSIYVRRLCAVPGDIIDMKKGILYVNNKNFDEYLNLMSYYLTTKNELQKTNYNYDSLIETGNYQEINNNGSVLINLTNKEASSISRVIRLEKYFSTDTTEVFKWLKDKKGYTVDNFGPLIIPKDCFFVLGDNRHNSMDSRYTGFVEKQKVKSVVLWK